MMLPPVLMIYPIPVVMVSRLQHVDLTNTPTRDTVNRKQVIRMDRGKVTI